MAIDDRSNLRKLHEEINCGWVYADPEDYAGVCLPRCDLESLGYVDLKLAKELVFGTELADATDAVEDFQFQNAPVKISVETDQMGFDFAYFLSKCRIRADMQSNWVARKFARRRDARRVDTMFGDQHLDAFEVGCGKTHGSATCGSVCNSTCDTIRLDEQLVGRLNLTEFDPFADLRARDKALIETLRIGDFEFYPMQIA
jgi:hypothetical protein